MRIPKVRWSAFPLGVRYSKSVYESQAEAARSRRVEYKCAVQLASGEACEVLDTCGLHVRDTARK